MKQSVTVHLKKINFRNKIKLEVKCNIVTCYLLTRRIILWVLDFMLDLLDTRQAELQSHITLLITSHEPVISSGMNYS
jgi:hypothetical protein